MHRRQSFDRHQFEYVPYRFVGWDHSANLLPSVLELGGEAKYQVHAGAVDVAHLRQVNDQPEGGVADKVKQRLPKVVRVRDVDLALDARNGNLLVRY